MKKVFAEPIMKRIELNLSENIAESGIDEMGFHFYYHMTECLVQETGKYFYETTFKEAMEAGCMANTRARASNGVVVPLDEVRMYMKP